MLALSRLAFILAVVFGICALVARFVQPPILLVVDPTTWLIVTGLLLVGSIALSLLGIADLAAKKQS